MTHARINHVSLLLSLIHLPILFRFLARPQLLILLIAMAGWAICGTAYADTIIGSPGAGFQSWTLDNLNTSCPPDDPSQKNCTPYWDYPTNYGANTVGTPLPSLNPANVGHCLTKTGGCNGVGPFDPTIPLSPDTPAPGTFDPPPGTIPFWGMNFNSATDTGGAIDPNFFFRRDTSNPLQLRATLELQLSGVADEINEFGRFETDSVGSMIGPMHRLFAGCESTPQDRCGIKPDPAGTTVTFSPTQFYGYYYLDFSEGNCFVATLSRFNEPPCDINVLFHNFAVFTTAPNYAQATFWIAGLNAAIECVTADCNLTLVKVQPSLP